MQPSKDAKRRSVPLWRFIEAAHAQSVKQEAAWLMWRVLFPKATRPVFNAEWREVIEWMSGAPL